MPRPYRCTECGAENVKLWREYQTFADNTALLCAGCCTKRRKQSQDYGPIREDGRCEWFCDGKSMGLTDQVCDWMVPAVPADGGETFWGYTSVPEDQCEWWRGLPLAT